MRKSLASDASLDLKNLFPDYKSIVFDKLIENIVIETLAEFIERFVIDSPTKEIHEKLQKKHQMMLSNHLAHLEKQNLLKNTTPKSNL